MKNLVARNEEIKQVDKLVRSKSSDSRDVIDCAGLRVPDNIFDTLCDSFTGRQFREGQYTVSHKSRHQLNERYTRLLVDRPDLRMLTTPAPDRDRPIFRWFLYKEAFSSVLVQVLLKEAGLERNSLVVDPFGGVGTVPMVAKLMGHRSIAFDLSPLPVFIGNTKLLAMARDFSDQLIGAADDLQQRIAESTTVLPSPDVSIWKKGFDADVSSALLTGLEVLRGLRGSYEEEIIRLLHLALLSVAESASHTVKDGTSLRLRAPGRRIGRAGVNKTRSDLLNLYEAQVELMAHDMSGFHEPLRFDSNIKTSMHTFCQGGDARRFNEHVGAHEVDVILTSPPYPNRYDYSAIYALELLLGFVENRDDLRRLRFSLLCSHLEAPWPDSIAVPHPAVAEIASAFLCQGMTSSRVFKMVLGYFDDMQKTIHAIVQSLRPGGFAFIVVGNVRIEGQEIPVDLILTDVAATAGLIPTKILVTRYKGTNSQQSKRFGPSRLRESVICLKQPE